MRPIFQMAYHFYSLQNANINAQACDIAPNQVSRANRCAFVYVAIETANAKGRKIGREEERAIASKRTREQEADLSSNDNNRTH